MTTRTPAGGPADDLETLLRAELGVVADAVGVDGRPAPASALLARSRTARRRRQAAIAGAAALAAAVVVAVGAGVLDPLQRSTSGPAVELPPPDGSPDTPAQVEAWIRALPVGDVPDLPVPELGEVARDSTVTTLPTVAGLSRTAVAYGSGDRGLLLGWTTDASGDNPPVRLGWLAPDGRWTAVDTLHLTSAAVSPDGATYVYAGSPATGPAGSVPQGRAFVQERTAADDRAGVRLAVPDGSVVKGWFDGGWLLVHDDGTHPSVLKGGALVPRDLVPTAPSGEQSIAITTVHGEVVTFTVPSFQGCPVTRGVPTVYLTATGFRAGVVETGLALGCLASGADPVSPDGTHFVRGGDELTVRSVAADGNPPVGRNGPELEPGAADVTWEPDGAHVQVEYGTQDDAPGSRFVVRCAVADGSCVRKV